MKAKILFCILLGAAGSVFAQDGGVGIGTTKPDNSAILDLSSSNKGLLMPRMSMKDRESIANPATGLKIYQTDGTAGEYTFDGKTWNKSLTTGDANSIAVDPNDWSFGGNAVTTGAYLGTNSNHPLIFKAAGQRVGFFDQTGFFNFFIGNASGVNSTTGGVAGALGSGSYNNSLGGVSLNALTTGIGNNAFGYAAAPSLQTGNYNTAIGTSALQTNIAGNNNVAIGSGSLTLSSGSDNMGLGSFALNSNSAGSKNVGIGSSAGFGSSGDGSVFIGYQAGYNETTGGKLYLANSNTSNPLIKGDFTNNNLKIHLGSTVSSTVGFLAIGDQTIANLVPTAVSNTYRLIVQSGILTEKIKVATVASGDWADYVFEKGYKMMSLPEVEKFVKINKHLPNVPSASDMAKNGLDVVSSDSKLLEKIEELTLYVIELNKEIQKLKNKK
jgi:hypothetical protein